MTRLKQRGDGRRKIEIGEITSPQPPDDASTGTPTYTQPGGGKVKIDIEKDIPRYNRPEIPDVPDVPDVPGVTNTSPVAGGPNSSVEVKTGYWETVTIAIALIAAGFLFVRT